MKKIAILVVMIMIFCTLPIGTTAAENTLQPSLSWKKKTQSVKLNSLSSGYLNYNDLDARDIMFSSSNKEVIPDDLIFIDTVEQSATNIRVCYIGIASGQTEITATGKTKTGETITSTITIKVSSKESNWGGCWAVDIGKTSRVSDETACSASIYEIAKFTDLEIISYETDEFKYVDFDPENNTLYGKKGGIENGTFGIKKYPTVKWDVELICNDDGIYLGGEVGNQFSVGEKVTEPILWNVKEKGKQVQLKVYYTDRDLLLPSMADITDSNASYESNNTDVAVIERHGKGLVNIKKNGTAQIDAYDGSICAANRIASATIVVTGCEETSNPDAGWVAVPEGEFIGKTGNTSTTVSLGNYKFSKQSFNDANVEAFISQEIKSGDVKFDIKVTTSNAKNYSVTKEELAAYMEEILKRTNICTADEEGTTGDVVAAYKDGYTSDPSSWTHDGSGSFNNGSLMTYSITVDKDRLEKGRKYQLVLGSEINAFVDEDELKKLNGTSNGKVTSGIGGRDAVFSFFTVSPAKNVVLDQTELTLKPNGEAKLIATMNDGLTTEADDSIAWSSSNESVVTVDDTGSITALKPGTAKIKATAVDGKVEAECTVTVKPVLASKITFSTKSVKLAAGQSKTVKATVAPADTTDKTVKWTTSSRKVATVSSKGTIKAVTPGKTTVTAKTTNGKAARVTVRVSPVKTSISVKAGKKSTTVKYKKVKGATKYQIYRAVSKNGTYKRVVTRSASKCATYKNTKLKAKKTYWYKVRSYKLVGNEKIYSDFSAPEKVTTKR